MDRRQFLAFAGVSILMGRESFAREQTEVVYLGAADCRYCAAIDANRVEQLVTARGWVFRRVWVNTFGDVLQLDAWPNDLRWLRATLPWDKGTPWFFTIAHNRLIAETNDGYSF